MKKTGLGRRIALILVKKMGHRTLFLGYAVMFSELIPGTCNTVQLGARCGDYLSHHP